MEDLEYFIYEEKYFCYAIGTPKGRFFSAVVMRAKVDNGGDPLLIDRDICVDATKIRISTERDCEEYKIKI